MQQYFIYVLNNQRFDNHVFIRVNDNEMNTGHFYKGTQVKANINGMDVNHLLTQPMALVLPKSMNNSLIIRNINIKDKQKARFCLSPKLQHIEMFMYLT